MGSRFETYQAMLRSPLNGRTRILLALSVIVLLLVFLFPVWTMSFQSNQYPDPLRLTIYVDHLAGQKTQERDDLREINSLNHYIGMRPLLESDFSEFLWMPFVIGVLALIILRAMVLGALRDLVDVVVLFLYFGAFSAWTFYDRLYEYGHNLDPQAAIKVTPFTPPFFGSVRIANFWVESYPGKGSYILGLSGLLLVVALAYALYRRRSLTQAPAPGYQAEGYAT
jgi:copper chaperone NosL